jgi:hypothetical protein
MDGKGRAIDNIFIEDYGGQSNTRMHIYNILTESAFTEDLRLFWILYNTHKLHQS